MRFRGRARLAVDSDISDSITAGMRLVTGNTSDLVSETQTLDGTAPYTFGLDELYIRLDERNAQRFPWLSVVGGKLPESLRDPHRSDLSQGFDLRGARRRPADSASATAARSNRICSSRWGPIRCRTIELSDAGQMAGGRPAREPIFAGASGQTAARQRRVFRLLQRDRPLESARRHDLQLHRSAVRAPGQHVLQYQPTTPTST